jgi:hypothetical protein
LGDGQMADGYRVHLAWALVEAANFAARGVGEPSLSWCFQTTGVLLPAPDTNLIHTGYLNCVVTDY